MLVLTRKTNQSIMIGDDIEVSVLAIMGEKIRIGIKAPREVPVFRQEVYLEIQQEQGGSPPDARAEVDVWKIEGVDEREDAAMLAEQTRSGEGRQNVVCVLLGRGAGTEKVEHWLEQASPVDGFIGFAIGRSIWWDALKGFLAGDIERGDAAEQIASNYLHFVRVYEGQKVS